MPPTPDFDIRHISLPVFGCDRADAVPRQVCGTAFPIGGGFFITAGHVAEVAREYRAPCLGFIPEGADHGAAASMQAPVTDIEVLPAVDMAIVRCEGGPYRVPPWAAAEVPILSEVFASGYPYALEREELHLFTRSYRGSVSSYHPLFQMPEKPMGYELTFPAPRGLSGAPLLTRDMPPVVIGVVVQNGRSQMLVSSDREEIVEQGATTIVERYEYLTYGLAVASTAILPLVSRMLGKSLLGHLTAEAAARPRT